MSAMDMTKLGQPLFRVNRFVAVGAIPRVGWEVRLNLSDLTRPCLALAVLGFRVEILFSKTT